MLIDSKRTEASFIIRFLAFVNHHWKPFVKQKLERKVDKAQIDSSINSQKKLYHFCCNYTKKCIYHLNYESIKVICFYNGLFPFH